VELDTHLIKIFASVQLKDPQGACGYLYKKSYLSLDTIGETTLIARIVYAYNIIRFHWATLFIISLLRLLRHYVKSEYCNTLYLQGNTHYKMDLANQTVRVKVVS